MINISNFSFSGQVFLVYIYVASIKIFIMHFSLNLKLYILKISLKNRSHIYTGSIKKCIIYAIFSCFRFLTRSSTCTLHIIYIVCVYLLQSVHSLPRCKCTNVQCMFKPLLYNYIHCILDV